MATSLEDSTSRYYNKRVMRGATAEDGVGNPASDDSMGADAERAQETMQGKAGQRGRSSNQEGNSRQQPNTKYKMGSSRPEPPNNGHNHTIHHDEVLDMELENKSSAHGGSSLQISSLREDHLKPANPKKTCT